MVLKSINLEDDVDLDTDAFRGCFIEVLKVSEGSEDHFERLLEGNCLGIGRFGRKDVPRN